MILILSERCWLNIIYMHYVIYTYILSHGIIISGIIFIHYHVELFSSYLSYIYVLHSFRHVVINI